MRSKDLADLEEASEEFGRYYSRRYGCATFPNERRIVISLMPGDTAARHDFSAFVEWEAFAND